MARFDDDLRRHIGDLVIEAIAARAVAADVQARLLDHAALVAARDAEIAELRADLSRTQADGSASPARDE